jgi:carbonic anhydrase
MPVLDELLQANQRFAGAFDKGDLSMPPARRVAVLTCMDARLHPEQFLGLEIGDAHVTRNAGGRASDDAIRSLVISSTLLGTTEFIVIHHTDCGMLTFTNDELRGKLADERGADASSIDFLPFSDLDQSVRDDVDRIQGSPLLADDITVSGFVYDVETGALRQVVSPGARAG